MEGLGDLLNDGFWVDWPWLLTWFILAILLIVICALVSPNIKRSSKEFNLFPWQILCGTVAFVGLVSFWPAAYKLFTMAMIVPLLGHCAVLVGIGVVGVVFYVITSHFPLSLLERP